MKYSIWCLGNQKDYDYLKTKLPKTLAAHDSITVTDIPDNQLPGIVITDNPDQVEEMHFDTLITTSASPFIPRFLVIKPENLHRITQSHLAAFTDIFPCESITVFCEKLINRLQRIQTIKYNMDQSKYSYFVHGVSPMWQKTLFELTEAALFSQSPILITGANGTGKELAAQWIHELSHIRSNDPSASNHPSLELTTVDCSTLSKELLGSELFGHVKGAFTGAIRTRNGALDDANNGTLFLDEIGEIDTPLQSNLLRVLQEGVYKAVGSNEWKKSVFRLISATNRDLIQEQNQGHFRQDLYYRLSGWECKLPSLRDRLADVVPLANLFLENAIKKKITMDACVESFFLARDYQGNVRELKHLCERISNRFVGGNRVTLADIPASDLLGFFEPQNTTLSEFDGQIEYAIFSGTNLKTLQQRVTDTAKAVAIRHFNGNLQSAAKMLGVHERTLQLHKARSSKVGV